MTVMCLIRHGETAWNRSGRLQGRHDLPLTETGHVRARDLARQLGREPWDAVFSSPLQRASQTAQIIAAEMGLAVAGTEVGLQERDYGSATGLTPEQRRVRFGDGPVPGMEDRQSAASRGLEVLARLGEQWSGRRLLVVTHGSVIKCILLQLRSDLRQVDVELLSATYLTWTSGRWSVGAVGVAWP